ncbi:MAG: hypothetical protein NTY77_05730 [Elusimicrobia bacterium]|nr:hypothetical protein [Elusimicrobiota bacterium]
MHVNLDSLLAAAGVFYHAHPVLALLIAAAVGTFGKPLTGLVFGQLTAWCFGLTAWAIPPMTAWVGRVMALILAHPLLRQFVVENHNAIDALLEAFDAALCAIALALKTAIEDAVDHAADPQLAAAPQQLPQAPPATAAQGQAWPPRPADAPPAAPPSDSR